MPRKERDWEVGPVLKEKADSQGTLFRGGTKYSSDRRFPRGYTPERLAEVREPIQGGTRTNFKDYPFGVDHPIGKGTGEARRTLVDTVARSTVPADVLHNVQFNPGQASVEGGRAAGSYAAPKTTPPSGSISDLRAGGFKQANVETPPRITLQAGTEDSYVPIHEIGHHVSHLMETPHSVASARTPAHRGQEEAFADSYGHEHFRDRKGNRMSVLRDYPASTYYGTGDDQPSQLNRAQFREAYEKHRPDVRKPVWDQDLPVHNPWALHKDVEHLLSEPRRTGQETLFSTVHNSGTEAPVHSPDFEFQDKETGDRIGGTDKWATTRKRLRWESKHGFDA